MDWTLSVSGREFTSQAAGPTEESIVACGGEGSLEHPSLSPEAPRVDYRERV